MPIHDYYTLLFLHHQVYQDLYFYNFYNPYRYSLFFHLKRFLCLRLTARSRRLVHHPLRGFHVAALHGGEVVAVGFCEAVGIVYSIFCLILLISFLNCDKLLLRNDGVIFPRFTFLAITDSSFLFLAS